jgi:D-xylose transport system ATP-binding protein
MSGPSPILEVRNLKKAYGAITAIDRIDLSLQRGEILALLGDNGAGKSTLIKCISGVHTADSGAVFVESEEVTIQSAADARDLGIETVYQDLALFDNLSFVANFFAGRELRSPRFLRSAGLLREQEMTERAQRTLRQLKVNINAPSLDVGLMSGGQRQAIAVARAVAFARKVVILDEPTAALGVREAAQVLELVKRLPEQGVSVIIISHNLEHVSQIADRAVVLHQGRVVGSAAPTAENRAQLVSMIVGGEGGYGHDRNGPASTAAHD